MTDREDLWQAVRSRQRSRSVVTTVTIGIGAAGLVTAGLVAYSLPGSQHSASSASTANAQSSAPPAQVRSGDDGGDDQGSASTAVTQAPAPAPTHVTSGGS